LLVEQYEKGVMITIRDTGAGMAPGEVGTLFQKYQRGSAAALNSGGSGIGLYLGKQIVELHGGTLTASSKGKNKGSEFTIRIPSK
jgi:signal transduction histidine kinase